MEVSHFELIFKPQSPAAPTGVAAVDRVIQGYFLAITNLENTEYRYRLEFVATPPPAGTPNQAFRSLAGNALVFVDSPGTDNQQGVLSGAITDEVFRPSTGFVRVAPRATALVAVLPSAFGPVPGDPTPLALPNFEVRGFVRISLPALFPGFGGVGNPFVSVPQAAAPVRVLLTPQNRATFVTAAGAISDQTQATLPLANGTGVASIPPDPGGPLVLSPFVTAEATRILPVLQDRLPELPPSELMAALLAQVDGAADLAPFNAALAKAGIGMALERRRTQA